MATPTTEVAIWAALKARVETIPLSPKPAIHWPNESLEAAGFPTYLRIDLIPNRTLRRLIGSNDPQLYRGILQISVMTKLNQQVGIAMEMASDIADHFPADIKLVAYGREIRIPTRPNVGQALPQTTRLMTPVSVEYECWFA